jgi:hypothetical protein
VKHYGVHLLVTLLLIALVLFPAKAASLTLRQGAYSVEADPASLLVKMRDKDGKFAIVSASQEKLGPVAGLAASPAQASWHYPDRKISVALALNNGELRVGVRADESGDFTFPVIDNPEAQGWILPMFEGVYVPAADAKWQKFLAKQGPLNTTADFTMPFIGLDCRKFTLTYIFTNPFNNSVEFHSSNTARLEAGFTHQFTRNHVVKEHGFVVRFGANSPVTPALIYREWLKTNGQFAAFAEKIRQTPEAAKLPGAAHIYLWGGQRLDYSDVNNWKGLCQTLKEARGEIAARVWLSFSPEAKKAVTELLKEEWPDRYAKRLIASELNRLLVQGVVLPGDLAAAFPGMMANPASWGDGVSPKMIQQLRAAGFDRLWLGCDGWDAFTNRPETVAAAKQAGYLIGPYDSFNSIHNPNATDTWETAQFGRELYETGAIIKADGTKRRGFKQKGFVLSPDAARPYVEKRVTRLMDLFHANSWFIDCDGFGDYFDDYSTQHPATQETDMEARISRMKWIRDTFGAVIGTEGCSAGVASTVHFAHGVLTPVIGWGDPDLTNSASKYFAGNYYPPDEPRVFFMPATVKEEYRYIYFEPRFRLPLFETVFHDSVIATHHWSEGSFKSKDLDKTVELLELLYNVPPLYHLNLEEFQKRKERMLHHYKFFSPLHRELAELPMTDFQWLTPDRLVQLTTFGSRIDLVANFGAANFEFQNTTVPPQSILASWRDGRKPILFTP